MIMAIPSRSDPQSLMYHSVDLHFSGDRYIFSFKPEYTADARSVIAGLLSYLRHTYNENQHPAIDLMFTDRCVDRNQGVFWNDEDFTAVTPDDAEVEKFLSNDTDYDFGELSTEGQDASTSTVILNRPDPSRLQAHMADFDNDSVSTFRTTTTPTTTTPPLAQPTGTAGHINNPITSRANPPSSSTVVSALSQMSIEDRMSRLEQQAVDNASVHSANSATLTTLSQQFAVFLANQQAVPSSGVRSAQETTSSHTSSSPPPPPNPPLGGVGQRP
jgi:hypothetical protein